MFSSLRPLSSLSLSRQFSQSSFFSSSQQQKTKREWGDKTREIQEERREKGKEGDEGVALYVHWPFCSSICNYCDFNRYLQNEHTYSVELETEMAQGLVKQIHFFSKLLGKRKFKTLYFGGGTPSLALPETLSSVIRAAHHCGEDQMEVTMEVNPGDLQSKATSSIWKEIGINRISLGVQSLRDQDLKILDRRHTSAEAFRACEIALEEFERVSIDLIYGRTRDDSPDEWRKELREALSLGAKHLSLYSLTVKPKTQLYKMVEKGKRFVSPEKSIVEMMQINMEETKRAGLNRYECSSYAAKDHECAHNIAYWTMGDYIGLGPGAYSRFSVNEDFEGVGKAMNGALEGEGRMKRVGLRQVLSPQQWTKAIKEDLCGVNEEEILSGDEVAMERVLVGLRMTKGIPLPLWKELVESGVVNKEALHELVVGELIQIENGRVRVSEEGFLLLDSVTEKLLV